MLNFTGFVLARQKARGEPALKGQRERRSNIVAVLLHSHYVDMDMYAVLLGVSRTVW